CALHSFPTRRSSDLLERVRAARSFRDFDDAATAPIHGFDGAADYYARSSSTGFLPHIRVPTLLLHADDDPFLPRTAFPRDAVREDRKSTRLNSSHVK